MNILFEKRKDLIQISLVVILSVFSVILFVYSLWNGNTKDVWVIVGLMGIVLIVLSELQGATVFIAVMLLGTLVAREEFILETSALFRGETLAVLRNSRNIGKSDATIEKISKEEITKRLAETNIDLSSLSPDDLISYVEETRRALTVEKASISLTDVSKKWIKALALTGGFLSTSREYKKARVSTGDQRLQYIWSLVSLGFVNVYDNDDFSVSFYTLSFKGKELAVKLNYVIKEKGIPEGFY